MESVDRGGHFWASYIQNNIGYSQNRDVAGALKILGELVMRKQSIPVFGVSLVLVLGAGGLWAWRQGMRPRLGFSLGAVATVTAGIMVLMPGRGFVHYLLFLVFPLSWWVCAAVRGLEGGSASRTQRVWVWAGLVAVTVGGQVANRLWQPRPDMFGRMAWSWQQPRSELAEVVRALKEPGDTLAVWGWAPDLYVQTRLPQATREAHTERQVEAGPQRDAYYRPRFLAELKAARPAFFVDEVGPGDGKYVERTESAHEIFPELESFLQAHYVLVADFHRERLYLRSDRVTDEARIKAAFERAAAKWQDDPWQGDLRPEFAFTELRPGRMIDGLQVGMMEPPASIDWPLQGTERAMVLEFGHDPKSYEQTGQGNGTLFSVSLQRPGEAPELLWSRQLNPSAEVADRGRQKVKVKLPVHGPDARLVIATDPGPWGDNAWDWAYVARMGFRYRPDIKLEP